MGMPEPRSRPSEEKRGALTLCRKSSSGYPTGLLGRSGALLAFGIWRTRSRSPTLREDAAVGTTNLVGVRSSSLATRPQRGPAHALETLGRTPNRAKENPRAGAGRTGLSGESVALRSAHSTAEIKKCKSQESGV